MSKGPSQTGTQTTSQIDPLRQEQASYLAGGWGSARNLYDNSLQQPYGGQTLATWGQPEQIAGYQNLYNAGTNAGNIYSTGLGAYNAAATNQYGLQNSPAYGGFQNIAQGLAPGQQTAMNSAAQAGQYGQAGANLGAGYGQQLQGIGTNAANTGYGYGNMLTGAAQQSANLGLGYGQQLQGVGDTAANTGAYYGNTLSGAAQQAANTGAGYGNMLTAQANQIPGSTRPAQQQLAYNARGATSGNPANDLLMQQASGAFVGANPHLDAAYANAADAQTRAYQTATAPRTASSFESAGRYGSPSAQNADSQNEQNLGKSLSTLGTDIYGGAYTAERQLQNQATSTLGSQYLTGLGQSTSAAQAAGQLGLGAAEAQQRGLSSAGQLALTGTGQQLTGYGTAANAAQQGIGQQLTGYNSAANAGLTGSGQQLTGYNSAANAALQGLNQQGQNVYQGGGLGLSGYNNAANAASVAGQLGIANTTQQQNALNAMQSGYQYGNTAALDAARMTPQMMQAGAYGPEMQQRAGAGLAGIDQAYLNDQKARYTAQQQAPWSNLSNYMTLIGQPTGTSSISEQPIYGSPTAQTMGMIGGANQMLGSPLSSLGTSALGSLGLGSAAPLGASAVAAGAPAVIAPGITSAGLAGLAGMNTGATAAALAPAAASAAFWIVCTELMRQGRMPKRHWIAGSKVFADYPERLRRGYYVWAIPLVRHLRKRPDSLLSRAAGAVFRWRAEDLAARAGVQGARKLRRGRAVTAALWVPCLALGAVVGEQDWRSVYREDTACR